MIVSQTIGYKYVSQPWETKVTQICESWKKTRYMLNQCTKGEVVDCIHFVAAVLDELYGYSRARTLRSLRADACLHNRNGVRRCIRAMLETYPNHIRVADGTLEAGDLVALAPVEAESEPAHVQIAAGPGRLWEASVSSGVIQVGYSICQHERKVDVYRATDKHLWLQS